MFKINTHIGILFKSKKSDLEEDNSDCSSAQYRKKFWLLKKPMNATLELLKGPVLCLQCIVHLLSYPWPLADG